MERIACHRCCLSVRNASLLQPIHCALAGIHLYRQRDEREECYHRIQANTDEEQDLSRAATYKKQSSQDNPCHPFATERHHRHQSRTQSERSICRSMLYCMSAFMRSDSRCCHIGSVIDFLREVNRFGCRVIMVGQLAFNTRDLHIIDTVIMQHFFRHFFSRHGQVMLRIAPELALQRSGYNPTCQRNTDKQYPIYRCSCHFSSSLPPVCGISYILRTPPRYSFAP